MSPPQAESESRESTLREASQYGRLTFLLFFLVLYGLLSFNNLGVVQIYRHRSLMWQLLLSLEQFFFAPTIWLTAPLTQTAAEGGWLGVMTFCEILFLSLVYGLVASRVARVSRVPVLLLMGFLTLLVFVLYLVPM